MFKRSWSATGKKIRDSKGQEALTGHRALPATKNIAEGVTQPDRRGVARAVRAIGNRSRGRLGQKAVDNRGRRIPFRRVVVGLHANASNVERLCHSQHWPRALRQPCAVLFANSVLASHDQTACADPFLSTNWNRVIFRSTAIYVSLYGRLYRYRDDRGGGIMEREAIGGRNVTGDLIGPLTFDIVSRWIGWFMVMQRNGNMNNGNQYRRR